jgi:hypothetical protein
MGMSLIGSRGDLVAAALQFSAIRPYATSYLSVLDAQKIDRLVAPVAS